MWLEPSTIKHKEKFSLGPQFCQCTLFLALIWLGALFNVLPKQSHLSVISPFTGCVNISLSPTCVSPSDIALHRGWIFVRFSECWNSEIVQLNQKGNNCRQLHWNLWNYSEIKNPIFPHNTASQNNRGRKEFLMGEINVYFVNFTLYSSNNGNLWKYFES